MTLSQADVLSQIETAKQQGMTLEQENGIVKIAKDAQVGFCSSLVWFGVDMTLNWLQLGSLLMYIV